MDSFLDSLNPQQREAVTAPEGPALVLAGAGSGKTRVLTGRAYYLIAHYKVNPNAILVMTFTNKAAGELQERLRGLVGAAEGVPWAGTFHSFCARLLRIYAEDLGLTRDFTIYDSADSDQIVTALLAERKISREEVAPAAMRAWISLLKNGGKPAGKHPLIKEAPGLLELYNQRLRAAGAVDFDDLLCLPLDLFKKRPEILERVQRRYDHVLIDEFQDTNRIQYDLALALALPQRNLYVVGDDDQSIYGWRGADYRNVFAFQKDLEGAQVYRLEQNYRSAQPILDVANDVICVNRERTDKKLWTENKTGEKAVLRQVSRSSDEAHEVIGEIHHLVRTHRHSYKDVAILFRTNALSRPFEEVLISQAIPYTIVGGTRFYERKEIKDLIAFLRLMVNPDDEQAWRRVLQTPPKGIGATTIQQLEAEARANGLSIGRVLQNLDLATTLPKPAKTKLAPAAEFIAALCRKLAGLDLVRKVEVVLEESGLIRFYEHYNEEEAEDRLTNLGQLVDAARDRLKEHPDYDLTEFLSEVALVSDIDDYDKSIERVTLMTLHAAKGLEYPVVFIVGVEEKLLPHSRSMGSPGELEEERRLFYVGLTRARERLYLTYSQTRYLYNHLEFQEPSRFLRDIAPEHIRGWSLPGRTSTRTTLFEDENQDQSYHPPQKPVYRPRISRQIASTPASVNSVIPYQIGDLVEHPDFGQGVVTAKSGDLDDLKIRVAFVGMGSKLLAVKFAQLKKVP